MPSLFDGSPLPNQTLPLLECRIVKRTWRERLFSRPWRPWKRTKLITEEASDGVTYDKMQRFMEDFIEGAKGRYVYGTDWGGRTEYSSAFRYAPYYYTGPPKGSETIKCDWSFKYPQFPENSRKRGESGNNVLPLSSSPQRESQGNQLPRLRPNNEKI